MIASRHILFALLAAILVWPSCARAQDADQLAEEVIANLAAGRVIIAVFKDGMVIATIENKVEAGTLTPPIVPITNQRAGVLLGATVWISPSSRQVLANLAQDLPRSRHNSSDVTVPHLTAPDVTDKTASDIEQTGLGFLVDLNAAAGNIHSRLDMSETEPLTQLILANYIAGYGPEVWQLSYAIHQEPERGDYWQTRVSRPRYTQFWPPEKKEPRTLVEFHYPADKEPTLRDLLLAHDERLEKIRTLSADQAATADAIVHGTLDKVLLSQGLPFLRAAIEALAGSNRIEMAEMPALGSFDWLVPPPKEEFPGPEKKNRPEGAPTLERPPGAPTLQKPPSTPK